MNQINDINRDEDVLNDLDMLVKKYGRYQSDKRSYINQNIKSNVMVKYGKPNEHGVVPVIDVSHVTETEDEKYVDPYTELIESKNDTINDLKQEIGKLKQKITDLTILYNTKIEQLRQEHMRELHNQHKEFMKKISQSQ